MRTRVLTVAKAGGNQIAVETFSARSSARVCGFFAMNSAAGVRRRVNNWRNENPIINAPLNGMAPYHNLRGQEKYGDTSVAR